MSTSTNMVYFGTCCNDLFSGGYQQTIALLKAERLTNLAAPLIPLVGGNFARDF